MDKARPEFKTINEARQFLNKECQEAYEQLKRWDPVALISFEETIRDTFVIVATSHKFIPYGGKMSALANRSGYLTFIPITFQVV